MMSGYPGQALITIIMAALLCLVPGVAQQAQEVVFENVFTGISAVQSSPPLRNIGQVMHVIQVTFPAETTAVAPIQVRIEGSYDTLTWFPISPDVVNAPVLDQGIPGVTDVLAYEDAYGAWRAVRVTNAAATPGGELMTVRYYGHLVPIVPFVTQQSDRWTF